MSAAATEYDSIEVSAAGGALTITLNRPDDLNPLAPATASEVHAALDAARDDPDVRCIVLTGAGRAFCSGADLKGGALQTEGGGFDVLTPLRTAYNPLLIGMRESPKPIIAAVNGPAVGIGASLALAADLVIAADSAYFLLAFVNIGLTVDGGASVSISARAGASRLLEMALLGDRVDAAQALDWGLVNRVVGASSLADETAAWCGRLAAGPPRSFAASKALVNASCYADFAARLDREAVAQQGCAETGDFLEGVTSFIQKRPAVFTGA